MNLTLPRRLDLSDVLRLIEAAQSPDLLDLAAAAALLGCTVADIEAWVEEGILPHDRVGGQLVFRLAALTQWKLRGEVVVRQGVAELRL